MLKLLTKNRPRAPEAAHSGNRKNTTCILFCQEQIKDQREDMLSRNFIRTTTSTGTVCTWFSGDW